MQLSGNLKNFALPELLHVMFSGAKTGILDIATSHGDARIHIERGAIIHAEVGELIGEAAIFRIFRCAEGDFSFHHGQLSDKRTVFFDSMVLMLEAARLTDEGKSETEHELNREEFLGALYGVFDPEEEGVADSNWEIVELEGRTEGVPPQPGDEIAFHPHLIEAVGALSDRLEACTELNGYAVHTRDGLINGGEKPAAPTAIEPPSTKELAAAFDAAEEIGQALGAGKLNCVVAGVTAGERMLFFQISGLMAATWPKKGVKPLDVLNRVTTLSAIPAKAVTAEAAN